MTQASSLATGDWLSQYCLSSQVSTQKKQWNLNSDVPRSFFKVLDLQFMCPAHPLKRRRGGPKSPKVERKDWIELWWKLKVSDAERKKSQVFEDMTVRSLEGQADVVKRLYFLSTRTSSLGGNFSWLSVKVSIYKALNGKHMTPSRDQGWAGLPAIN